MRATWRGLTLRGRAVFASGIAIALVAAVLGQRDLFRVAALLVALPLIAVMFLARRDDRVTIVRSLEPARVQVGGTAHVRLALRNIGRLRSGPLMITDRVSPALGDAPQLVLERLDPSDGVEATYLVDARVRGRHVIGPLQLTLEDPFGMVQISRITTTTHTLTVTPVVVALDHGPLLARTGGSGDGVGRRTAAAGQDDIGTRQYRAGDERRRVHWRATARTGELMVRQEETPWEAEALVLLDTRLLAHTRRGPAALADLTSSSFEWAVHAAASVGSHLARSQRRVRLIAGTTDVTTTGGANGALLDALAAVRSNRDGILVPDPARHTGAPVVVAILGAMSMPDVGVVAALRSSATTAMAIVLDTETWSRDVDHSDAGDGLTAPLRAAGWHTSVARHGEALNDVWDRTIR